MESAYKTVYKRVAVAGPSSDDLTPYLRNVYPSQAPVRLSTADRRLLQAYQRRKGSLHKLGISLGIARLAVITDPARHDACSYCDRCLWGCPRASIYNPRVSTLRDCEAYRGFRYLRNRFVISLLSGQARINGIRYFDTATNSIREESCDAAFLAAGALETGAIFLRTLKAAGVPGAHETDGLMDTAVARIPFLALSGIGSRPDSRSFQFNRLIAALVNDCASWPRYLHAELLHLTGMIYHPLIERMPFDTRLSKKVFFALKSALGAVTLFFPDKIIPSNRQRLLEDGGRWEKVACWYSETEDKEQYIRQSISRMRSGLRQLFCLPRGAFRSRPGSGIHYAGTVPMGTGPRRCTSEGRSNLFSNLFIADGAAFPSLPSKSITMSLAAHATRVARIADV